MKEFSFLLLSLPVRATAQQPILLSVLTTNGERKVGVVVFNLFHAFLVVISFSLVRQERCGMGRSSHYASSPQYFPY